MERELVRTCSAAQAAVLVLAAGRWARVGASRLCVREPSPTNPIDPAGLSRYLVRVEVSDGGREVDPSAADDAARILSDLFGPYLA